VSGLRPGLTPDVVPAPALAGPVGTNSIGVPVGTTTVISGSTTRLPLTGVDVAALGALGALMLLIGGATLLLLVGGRREQPVG
jgi:hypothetical protein